MAKRPAKSSYRSINNPITGRIYAKFGKYGLQNAYFCPVFLESSQNLRKMFGIFAKFAYLCDVKIKQIANNNQ